MELSQSGGSPLLLPSAQLRYVLLSSSPHHGAQAWEEGAAGGFREGPRSLHLVWEDQESGRTGQQHCTLGDQAGEGLRRGAWESKRCWAAYYPEVWGRQVWGRPQRMLVISS